MENELNLNIDEVLNFIKDFELTEDNVHDIIKYVQYKSILDSFTYVIETSKKSPDTGPFVINYLEITKKLEETYKKLIEKKSNKMEQDKLMNTLLIPEGYEKDSEIFVVEISIDDFPKNKEPHINDMVFFNEFMRFYSVSNSLKVGNSYRVELEKYCMKSQL